MAGQGAQARLIPACFLPGLTRTLERAHCSILIHDILLTLCSSTSTLGMDTGPRREYVNFPSIEEDLGAFSCCKRKLDSRFVLWGLPLGTALMNS